MKALRITMWIISIICIVIMTLVAGCYFFVDRPQTVGVVNISSLSAVDGEDVPLEDSTLFITVNALNNKNANGKSLYEIQFNTYMGISEAYKKEDAQMHSYGYQLYDIDYKKMKSDIHSKWTSWWNDDSQHKKKLGIFPTETNLYMNLKLTEEIYSYEMSYINDLCESVAVPYVTNSKAFIVSVKENDVNIPMELKLRGKSSQDVNYIDSFSVLWRKYYRHFTINSDFFIYKFLYTIESLSEGTHYFHLDLSDYFECRLYNEETKQFDKLTANEEFTWVTIKANISDDGVKTHNQSMFGMIATNDGSVTFEADSTSKYWQVVNNITLNLEHFEKRESLVEDGVYLYLKMEDIIDLNKYKNNRIHIVLNLTAEDKVLGFDNFALNDLNLYSCSINAETQQDFIIMPNALSGTGVTVEDIILNNVTLINLGGVYEG